MPALRIPEAPHPSVEWVRSLPPYEITREAFSALLDYSCSNPTGTTVGKVWRANLMSHNPSARPVQMVFPREGLVIRWEHPPLWIIKQYAVCDDPKHPEHAAYVKAGGCLMIRKFRPVFV